MSARKKFIGLVPAKRGEGYSLTPCLEVEVFRSMDDPSLGPVTVTLALIDDTGRITKPLFFVHLPLKSALELASLLLQACLESSRTMSRSDLIAYISRRISGERSG